MNLPAKQSDQLPLIPAAIDEAREPLARLFVAYPEPWSDKSASHAQEMIRAKTLAYIEAMEGIPGWAVARAVTMFIQGKIDRKRRDRLPTAEEVAVEARRLLEAEVIHQQAERRQREQIEERRAHEEFLANRPPAEERAKRAAEILRKHGLQPMPTKTAE